HRRFNAAFCHAIAADARQRVVYLVGALDSSSRQKRAYVLAHNQPRGIDRLVIVKRIFGRGAFAIAERARSVEDANEHDSSSRRASKAGFKRRLKRQFDFSKLDSFKV